MGDFWKIVGVNVALLVLVISGFEVLSRQLGYGPIFESKRKPAEKCERLFELYTEDWDFEDEGWLVDGDGIPRPQFQDDYTESHFDAMRPTDILLIGDSFTYGGAARPASRSFAKKLERKFNTKTVAMPGLEIGHYEIIARIYVPQYKPKIVLLVLYVGNDIRKWFYTIRPNTQMFWTAEDWVLNEDDWGEPFSSAKEAMEYFAARDCKAILNPFSVHAVLLQSVTYKTLKTLTNGGEKYLDEEAAIRGIQSRIEYIRDIAETNDSKFLIALIPTLPDKRKSRWNTIGFAEEILYGFNVLETDEKSFDETKFGTGERIGGNAHFNNDGHQLFFETIAGQIANAVSVGGFERFEGDFDGDGNADILWPHTGNGSTDVWLMKGTTKLAEQSIDAPPVEWKVVGIGDFNGDGRADILWRHAGNGRTNVWLMKGTAKLAEQPIGAPAVDWKVVDTGDFNGDGKADILWRHAGNGSTVVWLMDGTVKRAARSVGAPPVDWKVVGIGDFNGDSGADILWRNSSTGAARVWQMDGITKVAAAGLGRPSTDWVVEKVYDTNGDGLADIFWRNNLTEDTLVWRMRGFSKMTPDGTGVANAVWEVQ